MSYTIAYTLGRGKWGAMGLLLSRSIAEFAPDCKQIVLIPSNESVDIPADIRQECETNGKIVEADPPCSEYPIATKLKAFKIAAEQSEANCTVLLDTDTLVLDDFTQSVFGSSELQVRPAFFESRRWETGMGEVIDPDLFDEFGFEFPTETVSGAVDGKEIPACWNAGVVGTTDSTFPGKLLDLTLEVHEQFPEQRFADQIALAMLATEMDIKILSEIDNYPGGYRFWFPSDIRILHYLNFHHFSRIRNRRLRKKFRQIGLPAVQSKYLDRSRYFYALKYTGTNLLHRVVGW